MIKHFGKKSGKLSAKIVFELVLIFYNYNQKFDRKPFVILFLKCYRTIQKAQDYLISRESTCSFSKKHSSKSPTIHSPVPAGVPVKIRSPMFIEK